MFLLITSFIICFLTTKIILPLLRKRLLDKPGIRSSHKKPTPTGGGISFLITTICICIISSIKGTFDYTYFYFVMAIPLALIGFIDDFIKLDTKTRYFFQLLTVLSLYFLSYVTNYDLHEIIQFQILFKFICIFLISFFLTAIINFINFMDGTDGIVTSSMIIVFLAISIIIDPNYLFVVGILLSFLIFNWAPAKLFMGDVGSTFIAAIYIGALLRSENIVEFISLTLIATPLLGDAFFCVLKRWKQGEIISKPHKKHLYQRLNQSGWSHGKVAKFYACNTIFLFLILFIGNIYHLIFFSISTIFLGFIVDKKLVNISPND